MSRKTVSTVIILNMPKALVLFAFGCLIVSVAEPSLCKIMHISIVEIQRKSQLKGFSDW